MATFERVYIDGVNVQEIISFVELFYFLSRIEELTEPNDMLYYASGNRTFIFRQLPGSQ